MKLIHFMSLMNAVSCCVHITFNPEGVNFEISNSPDSKRLELRTSSKVRGRVLYPGYKEDLANDRHDEIKRRTSDALTKLMRECIVFIKENERGSLSAYIIEESEVYDYSHDVSETVIDSEPSMEDVLRMLSLGKKVIN